MNDKLAVVEHEPELPVARAVDVATTPAPAVDAAQARVGYVAAMLAKAYERASTLELTVEEGAKLMSEFPDEAVLAGANGDPNLLYISHAWLRERLHQVFGPGKWSLILRQSWVEDNGNCAQVYADCVLLVRGCFVGDAVGTMAYFKNNAKVNYSDALEGAKSSALSRIAGKDLSIGLQCWKKQYCDGWKAHKASGKAGTTPSATAPVKTAPAPSQSAPQHVPAASAKDVLPKEATDATREWMIHQFTGFEQDALAYAIDKAILMPNEGLTDWPLDKVPTSKQDLAKLVHAIEVWRDGDTVPPVPDESWKTFPVPFGKNAGKPLGDLETKTIWGFWANFKVEREYNGKPKKPETIAKDQAFRDALDAAGVHYRFEPPSEGVTP